MPYSLFQVLKRHYRATTLLITFIAVFIVAITGCRQDNATPLFVSLPAAQAGIFFENTIITSPQENIQNHPFIYNGGGVAVGDVTGNGLQDIFFAGNRVSSRLYINKGNMQFEDVTESAGVTTSVWASGASMVDINSNGLLDIYVSVSGLSTTPVHERANLLFINNGDGTFTESASEYNLADTSFTTHAAFLDYNRNGYLDVFLLNNSEYDFNRRGMFLEDPEREISPISFDRLYRNNGNGTFTDVSREAGLLEKIGYGLGVAVADINRNGWPDIYISNDLDPNDVLYVNNGDGTFTDKSADWLKRTSLSGMGVDIADFNNNGWPDIIQTDMMPEDINERKRMSGSVTFEQQREMIRQGSQYQFALNSLQMSNGMQPNGDMVFSEIARQAGVAYTDWTWANIFADLNNNGFKDVVITNGFPKAVYDFDYKIREFSILRDSRGAGRNQLYQLVQDLDNIEITNYLFKNDGNIGFIDKTTEWGFTKRGYSYGAAYADLNNNGRLDLIINNINAPASIYENVGGIDISNHYLQIQLIGNPPNTMGIGAEVILTHSKEKQHLYQSPYRGYASSVDFRLHFGLGEVSIIDSLEIFWPDGAYQLLTDIEANQLITLKQAYATEYREKLPQNWAANQLFELVNTNRIPKWQHQVNSSIVDFDIQQQIPYKHSQLGPVLASGDVTGNGLDDLYLGGGAEIAGTLMLQQKDGTFIISPHSEVWEADAGFNDTGALFFDANGNGLLDLYIASGGYAVSSASPLHQDRLYLNYGDGKFERSEAALPRIQASTQAIAAGDFTGNGQLDLFVGGRLVPFNYPMPPRSYLLRNDGGTFTDITNQAAPELLESGMITDALWVDFNGVGRSGLVTTGVWEAIQFFENDGGQLKNVTEKTGLPSMRGWWYSLAAGDFTNNGHIDFIAGNLGLNHTFTTSKEEPFGVYAADFNNDGRTNIFFTKKINGIEYPFFGLAKYGLQHTHLMRRFQSFSAFAHVDIGELLGAGALQHALHSQTDTFASVFIRNNGDGTFTSFDLPDKAQISPVKSIIAHDVDRDGNLDIILAGNIFEKDPEIPRADAGNGLWLKGDGNGNFIPISPFESGFLAPKDVKVLRLLNSPNGYQVFVGNNNDSMEVYSILP